MSDQTSKKTLLHVVWPKSHRDTVRDEVRALSKKSAAGDKTATTELFNLAFESTLALALLEINPHLIEIAAEEVFWPVLSSQSDVNHQEHKKLFGKLGLGRKHPKPDGSKLLRQMTFELFVAAVLYDAINEVHSHNAEINQLLSASEFSFPVKMFEETIGVISPVLLRTILDLPPFSKNLESVEKWWNVAELMFNDMVDGKPELLSAFREKYEITAKSNATPQSHSSYIRKEIRKKLKLAFYRIAQAT